MIFKMTMHGPVAYTHLQEAGLWSDITQPPIKFQSGDSVSATIQIWVISAIEWKAAHLEGSWTFSNGHVISADNQIELYLISQQDFGQSCNLIVQRMRRRMDVPTTNGTYFARMSSGTPDLTEAEANVNTPLLQSLLPALTHCPLGELWGTDIAYGIPRCTRSSLSLHLCPTTVSVISDLTQ